MSIFLTLCLSGYCAVEAGRQWKAKRSRFALALCALCALGIGLNVWAIAGV